MLLLIIFLQVLVTDRFLIPVLYSWLRVLQDSWRWGEDRNTALEFTNDWRNLL